MTRFGAHVACDHVLDRVRGEGLRQERTRRRNDPIDDDGLLLGGGSQDEACDGTNLEATYLGEDADRIRIELHNGPCWTLFINGAKLRNWGFHCPKGWRPWQQFVDDRDHGSVGRGCD